MIQVEYYCNNCNFTFYVMHSSDTSERNNHCGWCNNDLIQTGVIERLEDDYVVCYKDGKEIYRRKIRKIGPKT